MDKTFQEAIALCAYKAEEELIDQERALRYIEAKHCWKSFTYFLKYAKIVDPPTLDNLGGIIAFEFWEHLKQVIAQLLTQKLIVIMKSRQIGLSELIAKYALWYAMSHQGAHIMLFSKGEKEAWELLAKCRRTWGQLPEFLRLTMKPDSSEELGFPAMLSSIKAFAATETAGISYTASIVVCDEWDNHPYADQNYLASKPTRDAGGQFISIFTVDKLNPDTLAKAIFRDAMEGKNDFIPLFFPWWVRPGRDKDWYEHTKRNIPTRELAQLSPELYMEQNYPASCDEALRATQTVSAFDLKVIDEMMGDVKNPIKEHDIDPKIVNIYQDFHLGEYYIAATDTSHGVGKDFSVTTVLNVKTGGIVADIMSNLLSPEELAYHSVELLKRYHNPLWYIESNDWGGTTIATAQRLQYKQFGYQDDKKTKIGFNTLGYKTTSGLKGTRTDLFGALIAGINNHQISIYNASGLRQFYDIIRNASKEGRIEAMGGRHDDYAIAVGICWCMKDKVRTTAFPTGGIRTLDFPSRHR